MEMGFEDLFSELGQIDTERLSNRGDWCHSLNPTAFFLVRVRLRIQTKPVDQLNRIYRFINPNKGHWSYS